MNQCLSGVMLRSSASGLLHAAVHWNALGRAEEQRNGRGGLGSNYLEVVAGILNHPEPWTLNPKFKTPYKPHAESQWVPETLSSPTKRRPKSVKESRASDGGFIGFSQSPARLRGFGV